MEAFVLKTLIRLRKEAPKKLKDLRSVCDDLIEALSNNQKAGRDGREDIDADKYFDPLQAACESRNPRLMEIALDAIHYLIERGYLRGNKRIVFQSNTVVEDADIKASQRRTLMDLVVETIGKCAEESDDNVQLQVIKALLTAVTSSYCEVHEASLLLAVRSCFHIHLISKNAVNKTTTKAALTQMLSVVFQRMEQFDARAKAETEAAIAAFQRSSTEKYTPESEVEDSSRSSIPQVPSGSCMYQDVYSSLGFRPAGLAPAIFSGFDSTGHTAHVFPSILHKDAFLLFRALCKLSMKGPQEENSNTQGQFIALQNKILSLELLLHILQQSGPAFRSGDKFIYAIRQYLCVSLLGNCTSPVAQITGLAITIFVELVMKLKDHLKGEFEVFISNIFLRMLESENTSYEHKMKILEVFRVILKDPSAQVELFINYDCDFEAIDLFRCIVDSLAKIAKNPGQSLSNRSGVEFLSTSTKRSAEEYNLRSAGLKGLLVILQSLLKSANLGILLEASAVNTNSGLRKNRVIAEQTSYEQDMSEYGDDDAASVTTSAMVSSSSTAGITAAVMNASNAIDDGQIRMLSFDRKHKMNEEIELGILKFNLSPKKGLAYLSNLGHIEMTPKGVAKFLLQYQDRLDKTAIGEYLGRERDYEGGFCIRVLHEYVDNLEFENMHFDEAIRFYLSGFRLPGEAQKIDRIMEKFAERYYLQNRNIFASADMAFILAFSTIMLNTNLHNPAIRDDKRMTKEQFLRQNKGISADGEIPDDMLLDIYDRIQAYPIALNQDEKFFPKKKVKDEQSFVVFPVSNDKRRKDAFSNERREMLRTSEELFKQKLKSKRGAVFIRSAHSDEAFVRPMLEVAWAPMLSAFSQIVETSDDVTLISSCLEGFTCAIHLSSRLDVPTARDTFINSLAKFTTLDTVREIHPKNIECIRTLLKIAIVDGDYLFESWGQVLQCLSQLARMQLFAEKLHTDDMFFSEHSQASVRRGITGPGSMWGNNHGKQSSSDSFSRLFSTPTRAESARAVEESNAEMIMSEIDAVLIDRIFSNSQNLSSESVLHFVRNLCNVSLLEISTSSSMTSLRGREMSGDTATPRVFSLQKLVEVADINMLSRPRISWANIWNLLAQHFTTVGVHDNHALAMYAIDSLKQLSMKFLQKEELSNFNFQRLFLKPFEVIMIKSRSSEIKELILRCLDILILACASNIRSGWRSIFSIFSIASALDRFEICTLAFDITERLMSQHFLLLIFDFVELMNCLVAFVAGNHSTISLAALGHLAKCADHLAEGAVEPALESQHRSSDTLGISWEKSRPHVASIGEDASVFRLWWPLLLGLSTRVADVRLEVRTLALETLHRVLKTHGHLFSAQTWEVIFKGVLFPMIDSAKTDNTEQPLSLWPTQNPPQSKDPFSWIGTIAKTVLMVFTQLFLQYDVTGRTSALLPELLSRLENCIYQDSESLARIAMEGLVHLLLNLDPNNQGLSRSTADLICSRISSIAVHNLCLDFGDAGYLRFNKDNLNVPKEVLRLLQRCPISTRSMVKGGTSPMGDVGSLVQTPYGHGRITEITMNGEFGVDIRVRIQLAWGATLYTSENYAASGRRQSQHAESKEDMAAPHLSKEEATAQLYRSAMTSMVITLDCLRLLGELCQLYYTSWQESHLQILLQTLEACYHHGARFNGDFALRQGLRRAGFMRFRDNYLRLPHLLEQETMSVARVLSLALRLYSEEGDGSVEDSKAKFAEPWVKRMSEFVYKQYCVLDQCALTSPEWFVSEQLNAYTPSMNIVLKGVCSFSKKQFCRNIAWVLSMLTEVSLCGDRSIRVLVSQVQEKHSNPLLLQLVSKISNDCMDDMDVIDDVEESANK